MMSDSVFCLIGFPIRQKALRAGFFLIISMVEVPYITAAVESLSPLKFCLHFPGAVTVSRRGKFLGKSIQ